MNTDKNNTQLPQSSVSVSALIAQYLGWKNRNEYYQVPNLFPITDYDTGWTECLPSEMEFDKRWDCLMPVVEKICKEYYEDGDTAYLKTFGMITDDLGFMVRFNRCSLFIEDSLIQATFLAVGEFLQNRVQAEH
jgi:hypothetical protein